ncbi:DDE-type integrase/transposase/recombinase [Candidatus Nitrospira neomarina]|uniref:DDE-type integrase/transposase/recombinase n=1 Tax=Candidatus Nitrospira neomarina TaxID=3020899 RepID=A0AA96GL75_9BACT|nr:DDE-type integrase/transposase/recombinase [Candidatus Nitrospira neomarina]WNM64011.1 DDE-type integrase/transposase/recombinase [Candidatus Nitrospira neomarina]
MASTMETSLVATALTMAIGRRHPPPGLLHHSDRASQYASQTYLALLQRHQIIGSMSRRGNCWDNAVVERVPQCETRRARRHCLEAVPCNRPTHRHRLYGNVL